MSQFSSSHRSNTDPQQLNVGSMLLSIVFYFIFGLLLIFLRSQALVICGYVLAALLIIYGGFQIFTFIGSPILRKIVEPRLAIGLVSLLSGILLAFNPSILSDLFPVIWGLALFFGGFLKIQYAFAQNALKMPKWWGMLIFALVSLLIGTLALVRPNFLGENAELIIGIMLIVETVMDAVVFFMMNRALKQLTPGATVTIPTPAAEPAPAPAPVPAPDPVPAAPQSPESDAAQ